MHQTCRHIPYRKFYHWHHLHGGKQVFIERQQTLKQGNDNVFVSHKDLQINELICECLNFVDVVKQVVALLHLAHGKFAVNEEDVGQSLCLLNIANDLPRLRSSNATFNVRKLVIRQFDANDECGILYMSLILF